MGQSMAMPAHDAFNLAMDISENLSGPKRIHFFKFD